MKHTPTITKNKDGSPVVLELQNVKKSFVMPGGDPLLILDIPSFHIDAGELVALEGQSGSGKSTLLNVSPVFRVPTAATFSLVDSIS